MLKVDIGIAAYNEENCIGALLLDISWSKEESWFQIRNVYVISDASTDETDNLVMQANARDKRIKLIRKRQRKGKNDSVNMITSVSDADVVVILDADVRLANTNVLAALIRPLWQNDIALVGGNPIPVTPPTSFNPAEHASYFDWVLISKIRETKCDSFHSAYGRILGLSRNLYQNITLPNLVADDQFIYFSCLKRGLKFAYQKDVIVYYGLTKTIGDYCKQWCRFRCSAEQSKQMFGKDLVEGKIVVPNKLGILLSGFLSHPYSGLMWIVSHSIYKIEFLFKPHLKKDVSPTWDIAKTTKQVTLR